MQIIECDQLSKEWMQARLGSVGGSSIASVVAGGQGKMRKSLLYRLAGEILSGVKYESYTNAHMERGIEQEPEARALYEFEKDVEVKQVGLVKETDHKHYSPDGFVGDDGLIEIKCTIPSVHIEIAITDEIPPEYRKQCQWGLHICQRKWVDFISYSPLVVDHPLHIVNRGRHEELISNLNAGCDAFIRELLDIVAKMRSL